MTKHVHRWQAGPYIPQRVGGSMRDPGESASILLVCRCGEVWRKPVWSSPTTIEPRVRASDD